MTAETDICAGTDDKIGEFVGIVFWIAVAIGLIFSMIIMPIFAVSSKSSNFDGGICQCFEQREN